MTAPTSRRNRRISRFRLWPTLVGTVPCRSRGVGMSVMTTLSIVISSSDTSACFVYATPSAKSRWGTRMARFPSELWTYPRATIIRAYRSSRCAAVSSIGTVMNAPLRASRGRYHAPGSPGRQDEAGDRGTRAWPGASAPDALAPGLPALHDLGEAAGVQPDADRGPPSGRRERQQPDVDPADVELRMQAPVVDQHDLDAADTLVDQVGDGASQPDDEGGGLQDHPEAGADGDRHDHEVPEAVRPVAQRDREQPVEEVVDRALPHPRGGNRIGGRATDERVVDRELGVVEGDHDEEQHQPPRHRAEDAPGHGRHLHRDVRTGRDLARLQVALVQVGVAGHRVEVDHHDAADEAPPAEQAIATELDPLVHLATLVGITGVPPDLLGADVLGRPQRARDLARVLAHREPSADHPEAHVHDAAARLAKERQRVG